MNSLYGRYGTIYEEPKYITNKTFPDAVKRKFENVSICVAITAYARMWVYKYITDRKLELIYWDTDGIIIKHPLHNESVGLELRKFKLVAKIDKLVCLATKFYMCKSNKKYYYVFRGFRKSDYNLKDSVLYECFIKEIKTPS